MALTPEQLEFLTEHRLAALSTGRKDGSPQTSMVMYGWDGENVVLTFRKWSAKRHNIARQPRVALLVPDGRRALTVYGEAELLEDDPGRVDAFMDLMAGMGMQGEKSRQEFAAQLDEEGRVLARVRPTTVELHD